MKLNRKTWQVIRQAARRNRVRLRYRFCDRSRSYCKVGESPLATYFEEQLTVANTALRSLGGSPMLPAWSIHQFLDGLDVPQEEKTPILRKLRAAQRERAREGAEFDPAKEYERL